MNPWFGKGIILASSIVMVIIRAPHGQRSRGVRVVRSGRGAVEVVLLTLAWLAFFVPLVWVATPVFAFADYSLRPVLFAFRLGLEERMMLEAFGKDYEAYRGRTERLVPGIW